jgi:hypothetical protein
MPPEPAPEEVSAQLVPDIDDRAIAAYRRAAALAEPRRLRHIDTVA